MRVLRTTLYASPDMPMTGVVSDRDLADTLESFLQSLYKPDVFVCYDIFTLADNAEFFDVMYTAVARIDPDRERHMAILYFWEVAYLSKVPEDGALTTTRPAPLSAEEIKHVLRQVIAHPDYEAQKLIVHDQTGDVVMFNGSDWA